MDEIIMRQLYLSENSLLSECRLSLRCLLIFKAITFYKELHVVGKSRYSSIIALPSTSTALIRADQLCQIKHRLIEQADI